MTSTIWTEKYRPQEFKEVRGQQHIISKLEAFVNQQNMPHILFAGPAGVGKTTLSLVIAKKFFGENWHENFLELNASDERGIDVVRNKVKDFARTKALGDVPFKIIYLDECDALTKEAQQALRRTMENYTSTCRFILSCNYSSKIIDPIQSRCAVFKFRLLEKADSKQLIKYIIDKEQLTIDEESIDALIEAAGGDARRIQNILQSAATLDKTITKETIFSIASLAKPKELKHVFDAASKGDFLTARKQLLNIMLKYGLSGIDVIVQLQRTIWNEENISEKIKLDFVSWCGEAEFHLVEGSDEYVQLEALLAKLTAACNNS
ncbi:MAG: replication factor C small subunit [Candidatus Nanoarchaeia archaeon]